MAAKNTTYTNDRERTESKNDGERNETDPTATATTECVGCGGYVTRDYHRVFSDNDGELHGCPECEGHGVPRGGRR